MNGVEKLLLTVAMVAWIALGAAHVVIVMAGPKGLRPDRSAPGAGAVVGHPHETDPMMVAAPVALVRAANAAATTPLLLLIPEAADSADLLYARYQLAHILYPRRVDVQRAVGRVSAAPAAGRSRLLVVAPDVPLASPCRVWATAVDYRLARCSTP